MLNWRAPLGRVNRLIDWDWRPTPDGPTPAYVVYAVYRRRSADVMSALLASTETAHLWALDQVAPSLANQTRGSGPGAEFDLINRLLTENPHQHAYRVVSDDDYSFTRRGIVDLVRYQHALNLGVAQPAHRPTAVTITISSPFDRV